MNNEIIKIESVNNYLGKLKKAITITIIIAIIGIIVGSVCQEKGTENWRKGATTLRVDIFSVEDEQQKEEREKYMSKAGIYYNMASIGMGAGIASGSIALVLIIFYFITKNMKIVVTDKRVYGKTIFGKQVDLPFDSISAIAKSWFKGIAVSTASGRIVFLLISNNEEIFKTISDLLIQRQDNKQENRKTINTNNTAEELKQYKELLDSGIITQEEFNTKKKQILGL